MTLLTVLYYRLLRRQMLRGEGSRAPRERQIVGVIDRGLSNMQIVRELQIELATVKNHVHSILEKLCVEWRGAAAAFPARATVGL